MFKLVDLIKDGILLAEGDIVVCSESYYRYVKGEQYTVSNSNWVGGEGKQYLNTEKGYDDLSHWEVISFAKRTHDDIKSPVPDWCPIQYYCVRNATYYHTIAEKICWDEEEYPYMWEQCSPEYKAAWVTIAEEVK